MAQNFYTILTNVGKAKMANAYALGVKLNLTTLVVGDSLGTYYEPTEEQTVLKNQVWSGSISAITIDSQNSNWVKISAIIPTSEGGFTIREAGIIDDSGNLIAVGKYPETYKPQLSEGSSKDLTINMILEFSNTSSVTLKVDPTVILATKKDITDLQNQLNNITIPVTKVNNKTGEVVLKAADIKAEDGTTLEMVKEEFVSHSADTMTQFTDLKQHTIVKSNKDSNGIWLTIMLKRNDGTLYMKSILSGGTSPNYTTRTEIYYKTDGTTIDITKTYLRTYDSDGDLQSEVIN